MAKVHSLVDGEKYWLGAVWGIYHKDGHYFNLGNCYVSVYDTCFNHLVDDCPEPPEPEEPEVYTVHEVWPYDDNFCMVYSRTNDGEDRGYPTTYESWSSSFHKRGDKTATELALEHTGKTRQGALAKVYVYLNGELYDE